MNASLAAEHLAALSNSRERMNKLLFWFLAVLMAASAASALYNVFRVDQPWLRLGQVWALGVVIYLLAPMLDRGPELRGAAEPPARFLLRQHEERRHRLLWIRPRLFLALPSMLASWWGIAQVRGDGAIASSWPFAATAVGLMMVWIALGRAAGKAQREADELRRRLP